MLEITVYKTKNNVKDELFNTTIGQSRACEFQKLVNLFCKKFPTSQGYSVYAEEILLNKRVIYVEPDSNHDKVVIDSGE